MIVKHAKISKFQTVHAACKNAPPVDIKIRHQILVINVTKRAKHAQEDQILIVAHVKTGSISKRTLIVVCSVMILVQLVPEVLVLIVKYAKMEGISKMAPVSCVMNLVQPVKEAKVPIA